MIRCCVLCTCVVARCRGTARSLWVQPEKRAARASRADALVAKLLLPDRGDSPLRCWWCVVKCDCDWCVDDASCGLGLFAENQRPCIG